MTRKEFEKVEALREKWEEVFGDNMPWGFAIGMRQIPMLRKCVEDRSKDPMIAYSHSLPSGRSY